MQKPDQHPVIFFDGMCNLCSSTVRFVIKNDPGALFRFASLQSESGQQMLSTFKLPGSHFNSFILLQNGQIYTKSTGALIVARQLSGGWKWMSVLLIIPRFIRDGVYGFISNNRYKWFGKKTSCWLPTPALKQRFI